MACEYIVGQHDHLKLGFDLHLCRNVTILEKMTLMKCQTHRRPSKYMAVCQNLVPLVNPKIAGKWMFIPLKMVLIGIDPYPYIKIIKTTNFRIPAETGIKAEKSRIIGPCAAPGTVNLKVLEVC